MAKHHHHTLADTPNFAQSIAMRVARLMLSFVLVNDPSIASKDDKAACASAQLFHFPTDFGLWGTADSILSSSETEVLTIFFGCERELGLEDPLFWIKLTLSEVDTWTEALGVNICAGHSTLSAGGRLDWAKSSLSSKWYSEKETWLASFCRWSQFTSFATSQLRQKN